MSIISRKDVYKPLRLKMKEKKLTYKKLGEILNCDLYAISSVVRKGVYNSKWFPELAEILGMPIEYFLYGRIN